jgi:hypothetical protein
VGYYIVVKTKKKPYREVEAHALQSNFEDRIRIFYRITCTIQILIVAALIVAGKGNYHEMVRVRQSMNFLIELRVFPLIAFSYILQFISKRTYKRYSYDLTLFGILIALFVIVQARSLLVEVGCILAYYFCKRNKNKIKIKYIVILYILSILPNVVVLGRLSAEQADLSSVETWKNLFTYEYTVIFNNIVAEVIYSTKEIPYFSTILTSFGLMIPSFIREMLGITIDKEMINSIANDAGVFGGGFSLFAELYLNFGWFALAVFFLLGSYLGNLDKKWFCAKRIKLKEAIIPLIYSYIVLGLRNDLGVTIKQIIQIYVVVMIINIILRIKFPANALTSR